MDEHYMRKAIELAKLVSFSGDVPIGALVVYQDSVIGQGYNQKEAKNNALYHAELQALNQAANYLDSWWLEDRSPYVTLEPCSMCAGVLTNTRISRLVYGVKDKCFGVVDSSIQLLRSPASNHELSVQSGVLEEECSSLLTDFFKNLGKWSPVLSLACRAF